MITASARPHVLYVVLQVFLLVAERPNQRPLKLGKKPMLGARGIRAVEVLFPMEDVDVVPREPDLQQGLDGSLSHASGRRCCPRRDWLDTR